MLRNDHDASSDWIVVVPRDARARVGNRHAVGAEVRVTSGGVTQRRWIAGGGPFQSNNAPEAHFGLGTGGEPVDVEVVFPDGRVEARKAVPRGSRLVVERATDG